MDGNGAAGRGSRGGLGGRGDVDEGDFGCFCRRRWVVSGMLVGCVQRAHTDGIVLGEDEAEAEDLIQVERVGVQDSDVDQPFSEVVCLD